MKAQTLRWFAAIALMLIAVAAFAQAPAPTSSMDADSRDTQRQLRDLLRRYPPQVATVLKLDPTLLSNQPYMANYPALAAFVSQHPDIQHNPRFFFEGVPVPDSEPSGGYPAWREVWSDVAGFTVFLVITLVLMWAVKTLVEQRRWSRLSSVQTEVHSRLLDRFTSNEELLAYLQTGAGKRFLESAPLPVDAGPRPLSAPFARILWSMQVGLVMIAIGIGFDLVSLQVTRTAQAPLYGIGVISLLIGIALLVSAAAFYFLSRKFGLMQSNLS